MIFGKDSGVAVGRLKVVLELPSNEAVRAAVETGAGATAISGALSRARLKLPDRTTYVVRHRERYHSRAGDAFMAITAKRGIH